MNKRLKKVPALLIAASVITAAAFIPLTMPAYAGSAFGGNANSYWKTYIEYSVNNNYSTTQAYVSVTLYMYFNKKYSNGCNMAYNSTSYVYCDGQTAGISSSWNHAPSAGQYVNLGSAGFVVNKGTSARTITIQGVLGRTSGYSVLKGSSTASGTDTVAALPAKTVRYNANHEGPGGSSTRAELTGDAEGLFIAQDGTIQLNGTDLSTTSDPGLNMWDVSGIIKKGYHINAGEEWNSSADGTGTSYDQAANYTYAQISDMTVYINWQPNAYNIQYLPNGADSGAMPRQQVFFDNTSRAISNAFMKDGYKLRGWDRDPDADPDGELDVVGDKGVISNDILADGIDGGLEEGGTVQLYAIWGELGPSESQVYIGKVKEKTGSGEETEDEFVFRFEPVEAFAADNESTTGSGHALSIEDMPMPEGSVNEGTADAYKEVTVTGLNGSDGMLRSASTDTMSFEEPGWYMYRVSEITGSSASVTYDRSSYYVTVYVQYLEDTGLKLEVVSTTAWHNRYGQSNYRPNTEDMSAIPDVALDTDRDGRYSDEELSHFSLRSDDKDVYGKTGLGRQGVQVTFWNTEYTEGAASPDPFANLRIMKNLKGNLGDRTKRFEYEASLSGLAANAVYAVANDGAELGDGFTGDAVIAGEDGRAELAFRLRDDESLCVEELPLNTEVNVTESGSDHVPGYIVYTDNGTVKTGNALFGNSVSTGSVTMSQAGETYTVLFDNFRELAPVTGIAERGLPIGIFVILLAVVSMKRAVSFKTKRKQDLSWK